MKRREAKFVHASPRLAPNQLEAAPRVRETKARRVGKGTPTKEARAAASERPKVRIDRETQPLARPKRHADEG
jgi:hypothetical protein